MTLSRVFVRVKAARSDVALESLPQIVVVYQRGRAVAGGEYRKACWVRLNKNKARRIITIAMTTAFEFLLPRRGRILVSFPNTCQNWAEKQPFLSTV